MLNIDVVYCLPDKQWLKSLVLAEPCSVQKAIEQSAVLKTFPQLSLFSLTVGIFSRKVSLSTWLKDGDRVEIYRQLTVDPKQARRQRALHS